ncbi:LysR family transcriptional regulator [Ruegeria atlantica]|uniref:Gcv operon activator n=1 Tax=Ruegeria atlantica TaxID=81569 RepID=A0A0P1EM29_9RHOB|nr:LysR family transcriptional regulator [Ruegeria atlantica]CUH42342.1 Gcv operon activator [Ruegeria atlantica]
MKSYRKSLPPLDSLLFFHAAAGNQSLTLAAEELFVTQAAVSKRIHRLEEWLGAPLFSREGRKLELTESGRELASDMEIALEFLDRAIYKIKVPKQPAVQIAATTALSMFWLHQRLKSFSFSDAACDINILTTESTSELLAETQNLAIVYCDGKITGWDCVSILDVEMVPVVAPEIARQAERSRMFSGGGRAGEAPPLLEFDSLAPEWINWRTWLKKLELPDIDNWSTLHCNSYVQSVGKALEGAGVALVNASMLESELTSGALVKIGNQSLRPGNSYHLCRRQNASLSPSALRLYEFLATKSCAG